MKRAILLIFAVFAGFLSGYSQGCNLSNYTSATILTASSYPFTSPGSGITVSATATNTPTLSNTSYSCNGQTFATASPAWWQNASNSIITLTFSVPVSKFTVVVNGTNDTEEFSYFANAGSINLSDMCATGWSLVSPSVARYNQVAASGSIISINNPSGATQFTLRHNGVGSGSRIALLDCFVPAGVLPVTIGSFHARHVAEMQINRLDWQVTEENQVDVYEIHHSTDGDAWEMIGSVDSKGNSTSPRDYSFAHTLPPAGLNHYKLRTVDMNGNFIFSEVRDVMVEPSKGIAVFPNPTEGRFRVLSSLTLGELTLTDLTGKVLRRHEIQGEVELDLSGESRGTYIISVKDAEGGHWVERLVLK